MSTKGQYENYNVDRLTRKSYEEKDRQWGIGEDG